MSKTDLSYSLRLKLYTDEKFFGLGVATLLEHVQETRSLLQASKKISMAYTKALKILKKAEDNLGYKLLIRQTGGVSGGGSYLTQNAIKLLKLFRQFEADIESFADKKFEILSDKMNKLK